MDNEVYKILISHGIDDNSEYDAIKERLSSNTRFKWEEISYDKMSDIDSYTLEPVDAILILSGLYDKNKEDIMHLIKLANEIEVPVVLIRPYGMEEVPEELEELSTGVIGWSPTCIVESIYTSMGKDPYGVF